MSPGVLQLILGVFTVFCGGSAVQLVVLLVKRKADLRKLDAESDSVELTSAREFIETLLEGTKALQEEVRALKSELKLLRADWDVERAANTEALSNAVRQGERILSELARVKTDLALALAQIVELDARLARRGGE
jgi:predicted  nucleic acid-binding Zn-ribbon protein